MTILAFYPVNNSLDWERHTFDNDTDEEAFKTLWMNRISGYVNFYDMESHFGNRNTYDIPGHPFVDADDFETDYNDEELDGGWWVKPLHVPSDAVKRILAESGYYD